MQLIDARQCVYLLRLLHFGNVPHRSLRPGSGRPGEYAPQIWVLHADLQPAAPNWL